MKRQILAGILGGIAMYAWSSLAHIATPLGMTGLSELPNEQVVLDTLRANIGDRHAMFYYPGMGGNTDMAAYEQKLAGAPNGLLIYHPPGGKSMQVSQLVGEFLSELFQIMLAVFLLSKTSITGFGGRAGFITAAGVLAGIGVTFSYWNWFGFPTSYSVAQFAIIVTGYLAAGLTAAAVLRKA
jgi:hypothetical protein